MKKETKTTTYLLKDIDGDIWRQFRGMALCRGFDTAGACLNWLVKEFSEGGLDVKR